MKNNNNNFIGIALLAVGTLLLAGNIFPTFSVFDTIGDLWPLVLIILGLYKMLCKPPHRNPSFGILLILVGGLFQLDILDVIEVHFFPLIFAVALIWIGVTMIIHRSGKRQKKANTNYHGFENYRNKDADFTSNTDNSNKYENANMASDDLLSINSTFSEIKHNNNSKNFIGGSVSATFGSAKVNLQNATLAKSAGILELNATFGGVTAYIPQDWNVLIKPQSTAGEIKVYIKNPTSTEAPFLEIWANATFGEIKIINSLI